MVSTLLKLLKFVLLIITVIFGFIFHLKNGRLVVFDYYFGQVEWSLSLLFFIFFSIGALFGYFFSIPLLLKLKYKNYRLSAKQKKTPQEDSTMTLTSNSSAIVKQ